LRVSAREMDRASVTGGNVAIVTEGIRAGHVKTDVVPLNLVAVPGTIDLNTVNAVSGDDVPVNGCRPADRPAMGPSALLRVRNTTRRLRGRV
jgi:hypothetical protein